MDQPAAASRFTNDPFTLDIIENSLQAISDEMFAAMRKTAMSAIIYEVLDMGTGITNAKGEIASSGAGIPGFIGVLDKAVMAILEKFDDPATIRPGDVFATSDPVPRRRHPPERRGLRHAGVRRRRDHRLDREHRPLERRRRDGAGLDVDRRDGDLPGGVAPAGHQGHRGRPSEPGGHGHHGRQLPPAGLPARRHVGGDRGGPDRRAPARRHCGEVRRGDPEGGDRPLPGLW